MVGSPAVTLGLQHETLGHAYPGGDSLGVIPVDVTDQSHALQTLGLDNNPAPPLELEHHHDHPSLSLDPQTISIDHQMIAVTELQPNNTRNGDLRKQSHPPSTLSTFNPNPSPSTTFSGSDLEGHLV